MIHFIVKNRTVRTLLLMLLASSLLFTGPKAYAGSKTRTAYDDAIEKSEKKQKELKKAAKDLLASVQIENDNVTDLELYILTVDGVYAETFKKLEETKSEIEEVSAELLLVQKDLEEKKAMEQEKYDIMKERVRYMYEEGNVSFMDVLFGSKSFRDFLNRLEYRKKISKYDNDVYEKYEEAREEAEQAEHLLNARMEELTALREYNEKELEALENLAAGKSAEITALVSDLGIDSDALYENWDRLMETEDESGIEAVLKEIKAEEEADYKLENIMWPLPGRKYISSKFGYRNAPTAGAQTFHSGIDIPANTGTEAKAALSGVVVAATYDPGSGNYVKISHGNGVYTSYCHASKLMVKVGDKVKKGQTVVLVGSTGVSTGPHLHFGIQINGKYTNPSEFVWPGKE